jgi:hypothetical protein
MEGEVEGKTFKMKGHTLPGINQRSEGNTDLPDGRSKSSAFQQGIMGAMGATGNIAEAMQQRRNPGAGIPGMGAGVIPGSGFPLKPSIAKDMKTGTYKQSFENPAGLKKKRTIKSDLKTRYVKSEKVGKGKYHYTKTK